MQDKYLKIRLTTDQHSMLKIRAADAGKRLGTYSRELLQRETAETDISEILARIELAIQASSISPELLLAKPIDPESQRMQREVVLIVRELAMNINAQILQRVAAQLNK